MMMNVKSAVKRRVAKGLRKIKSHLEEGEDRVPDREEMSASVVSTPAPVVDDDYAEEVDTDHGVDLISETEEEEDFSDLGPPGLPLGVDVTDEQEQAALDEWSAALQAELEELGREVGEVPAAGAPGQGGLALGGDAAVKVNSAPLGDKEREDIGEEAVGLVRTIFDPEIPVDIYELGLIYGIDVQDDRNVAVSMTLTSPNCPAAQSLPAEVEQKLRTISGVNDVRIDITFDPPWDPSRMSEAARLELNLF